MKLGTIILPSILLYISYSLVAVIPSTPGLSQCEFRPGEVVKTVSRGEVGRVVAIHNWDGEKCVVDVKLGDWVVEDMPPEALEHAE